MYICEESIARKAYAFANPLATGTPHVGRLFRVDAGVPRDLRRAHGLFLEKS
jgi:hypothetical protein